MKCPKCDGTGRSNEPFGSDCQICGGTGEAPETLPCGHPIQCLRLHGDQGSSCAWCVEVMVLKAQLDDCPAEHALDEIARLCGCPQWDYPGQVVRDVGAIVDKAQRFDLDQAGIEQREKDAVELVELRARIEGGER